VNVAAACATTGLRRCDTSGRKHVALFIHCAAGGEFRVKWVEGNGMDTRFLVNVSSWKL